MIVKPPEPSNHRRTILVPKGAKFSGPCADQLARFASYLMHVTASRNEYIGGYWINVAKERIRSVAGSDLSRWELAAHSNIIDKNPRYCAGKFSQSYRLTTEYRTGETETYALRSAPKIRKANAKCPREKVTEKLLKSFEHFWLPDQVPYFENAWQRFTWERIASRDFYGSRCEYGRFHSNFTAFKHRHRVQASSPLVAVDVVGCQPLILGALALKYCECGRTRYWLEVCQHGDIYDEFKSMMPKVYQHMARSDFKKEFLRMLFEDLEPMKSLAIFRELEIRFPGIAKYLTSAKEVQYQQVAWDCQSAESNILINGVAWECKFSMITCHDEFIIPEKHIDKLKASIYKHFGAKLSVRPRLSITPLSADNQHQEVA